MSVLNKVQKWKWTYVKMLPASQKSGLQSAMNNLFAKTPLLPSCDDVTLIRQIVSDLDEFIKFPLKSKCPSTLRQQEDPFLCHHNKAPMHRVSWIKKWFCVEDVDWPSQSPDLHLIQHLRDEQTRWLQARSHHPASVPDAQRKKIKNRRWTVCRKNPESQNNASWNVLRVCSIQCV